MLSEVLFADKEFKLKFYQRCESQMQHLQLLYRSLDNKSFTKTFELGFNNISLRVMRLEEIMKKVEGSICDC